MKKAILATVLGLFCMSAYAQYRPSFIVSGGYQGANVTNLDNSKLHHGFRVGVAADFGVYDDPSVALSIQPGVYYSWKGYGTKAGNDKISAETNATLGYIEVPVLVNARFGVDESFSAFVNAGPYVAYGVNSKSEGSYNIFGLEGSSNKETSVFKKNGDNKSLLNPFDAGLQIGAGIEYNRVQLGVGYQLGLTKLNNYGNTTHKNTSFFATVGYRF